MKNIGSVNRPASYEARSATMLTSTNCSSGRWMKLHHKLVCPILNIWAV